MSGQKQTVAGSKVLINTETLAALRQDVLRLKPAFACRHGYRTNYTKLAESLAPSYPFGRKALTSYCISVGESSDYLFSLCADGKISYSMFQEITLGLMSPAYRDKLAMQVVEKSLTPAQVRQIKRLKKKYKDNISLAELVQRATGVMDGAQGADAPERVESKFGDAVSRVLHGGAAYSNALDLAISVMPDSVIASGSNYLKIYDQVTNLVVELERTLPFLKQKKADMLAQIKDHVVSELGPPAPVGPEGSEGDERVIDIQQEGNPA